jgi:hypothetical protein
MSLDYVPRKTVSAREDTDLKEIHPDEDSENRLVCFTEDFLTLFRTQLSGYRPRISVEGQNFRLAR